MALSLGSEQKPAALAAAKPPRSLRRMALLHAGSMTALLIVLAAHPAAVRADRLLHFSGSIEMMRDPRVFFAAERTLLAWVRTGLTIMAFGFVVARFGLFLRLLAAEQAGAVVGTTTHHDISGIVGIALVLVGTACMILGAIQHRSYVATLPPADVPRTHDPIYPIMLALFLAALGIALAIYLLI